MAVLFDAYRSYYDQAPDFKGALGFITERIAQKDSVIFVVMLDAEIIGFTQLYPIFTSLGMKKGAGCSTTYTYWKNTAVWAPAKLCWIKQRNTVSLPTRPG